MSDCVYKSLIYGCWYSSFSVGWIQESLFTQWHVEGSLLLMESGMSDLCRGSTWCDGTTVSMGFTVSFREHPDSWLFDHLCWTDFYKSSCWPHLCLQSNQRNPFTLTGVIRYVLETPNENLTLHSTYQCISYTFLYYVAIYNLYNEVINTLYSILSVCYIKSALSLFVWLEQK